MTTNRHTRYVPIAAAVAILIVLGAAFAYYGQPAGPVTSITSVTPVTTKAPVTKTLIVGTIQQLGPGALDPAAISGGLSFSISVAIAEPLWGFKPNSLELESRLVSDWRWVNPTTLEVDLKRDIKFHDGTPLNATAVKYSLERVITLKKGGYWILEPYLKLPVEVVSQYTARIHLLFPHAGIRYNLGIHIANIISPSNAKFGNLIGQTGLYGTGPFKMVRYIPDDELVLEANKDYHIRDRIPKVDRIVFKFFKSGSALRLALEKGEIDATHPGDMPMADVPDMVKKPNIGYLDAEGTYSRFISFNGKYKHVSNLLVRRAVAYAIDYEAIAKLRGGTRTYSLLKNDFVYIPLKEFQRDLKYDPAKAKQLLADAGYPAGIPDKIDFYYSTRYGMEEADMAALIQANLKQVGINLELHAVDWPTMNEQLAKGMYPMFLFGCTTNNPDPDSTITSYYSPTRGIPCRDRMQISTYEQNDRLLDQARNETDMTKKAELYTKMLELSDPQCYTIFMYRDREYVFYQKNVKGLTLSPMLSPWRVAWELIDKETT